MVRYVMASNGIILSFEKSDYYTLQEACDYLNIKNSLTNITPKKLMQAVVKYDTNAYVYGKGFGLSADIVIRDAHSDNVITEKEIMIADTTAIQERLNFHCCYYGLLLLLNNATKTKLIFKSVTYGIDVVENDLFCGALDIEHTDTRPSDLNFIQMPKDSQNRHYSILALYPRLCYEYYDYVELNLQEILPKLKQIPVDKDDENALLHITIDDVIILHKDLMELEANIINDSPTPQKQIGIKPKKGVSFQKLQAKEQARIIAKALWRNDKDKKIRIKEMANIVYSELWESDFKRQLPNNQDSLQDWIRDIAPDYATKGGRPPNEP